MISEATTNYKKQALQDIIDFISGKIQESEFLQKYKVNATKSHDYVDIVSDVLHSNHVYDAKFAKIFSFLSRTTTIHVYYQFVNYLSSPAKNQNRIFAVFSLFSNTFMSS